MSLFGALNTAVSGLTGPIHRLQQHQRERREQPDHRLQGGRYALHRLPHHSSATDKARSPWSPSRTTQNNVQGTITQSSDSLAMAISGQGFFSVSDDAGTTTTGATQFNRRPSTPRPATFR